MKIFNDKELVSPRELFEIWERQKPTADDKYFVVKFPDIRNLGEATFYLAQDEATHAKEYEALFHVPLVPELDRPYFAEQLFKELHRMIREKAFEILDNWGILFVIDSPDAMTTDAGELSRLLLRGLGKMRRSYAVLGRPPESKLFLRVERGYDNIPPNGGRFFGGIMAKSVDSDEQQNKWFADNGCPLVDSIILEFPVSYLDREPSEVLHELLARLVIEIDKNWAGKKPPTPRFYFGDERN